MKQGAPMLAHWLIARRIKKSGLSHWLITLAYRTGQPARLVGTKQKLRKSCRCELKRLQLIWNSFPSDPDEEIYTWTVCFKSEHRWVSEHMEGDTGSSLLRLNDITAQA
jgi:hypothetical protein